MRKIQIDFLKGIAILAVIFYHFGVMPNGYLGVDLFLVVNGYFITKGLLKSFENGSFSYFSFLWKRGMRLWPLILLLGAASLVLGYFTMLPDDYENVAQGVMASNVFSNNILASLTTKNYWIISNAFKPEMHTWYVGIIMQMYVVYPLILLLLRKISAKRGIGYGMIVLTVASLVATLLPTFPQAYKFYHLPFRFFEMGIGAIVAIYSTELKDRLKVSFPLFGTCLLSVVIMLLPQNEWNNTIKVLIVSLLGGGYLLGSICLEERDWNKDLFVTGIAKLGKASYSLFIWHQFLYAFYVYIFNAHPAALELSILTLVSLLVGWFSYILLEQKLYTINPKVLGFTCVILLLITTAASSKIYLDAGVMRDVPELDVNAENKHRGMHAEYCDRIYGYQHPFENNGKLKVFTLGNSFARDMSNILLESNYCDSIDLSYKYVGSHINSISDIDEAIYQNADAVFLLASAIPDNLREEVLSKFKTDNIWTISTKSYGGSNGNIYNKKRSEEYYDLHIDMEGKVLTQYFREKAIWGERYVDLVAPVADVDMNVRVFTDDHKYISQDCRHLTQAGARYYSRILPIGEYIGYE